MSRRVKTSSHLTAFLILSPHPLSLCAWSPPAIYTPCCPSLSPPGCAPLVFPCDRCVGHSSNNCSSSWTLSVASKLFFFVTQEVWDSLCGVLKPQIWPSPLLNPFIWTETEKIAAELSAIPSFPFPSVDTVAITRRDFNAPPHN